MNTYLIAHGGKRFATNAENMMEAEDKLADYLELEELQKCQVILLESMDVVKGKDDIIYF